MRRHCRVAAYLNNQLILACVVEMGEKFGAEYVTDVLRGADTARIARMRHNRLESYGRLRQVPKAALRGWLAQLEAQGCLARDGDEYPVLTVTAQGRRVMGGEEGVTLTKTIARPTKAKRPVAPVVRSAAGGVTDDELFESLRALRRTMAEERGIPHYLIFSDASLREMARARPTTKDAFLQIKGVGLRKLQEQGPRFLACIREDAGGSDVEPPFPA